MALGVLTARPYLCTAGSVLVLAGAVLFAFLMGYSWLPMLVGRRPQPPAEPA
jgi:hypothetical protein